MTPKYTNHESTFRVTHRAWFAKDHGGPIDTAGHGIKIDATHLAYGYYGGNLVILSTGSKNEMTRIARAENQHIRKTGPHNNTTTYLTRDGRGLSEQPSWDTNKQVPHVSVKPLIWSPASPLHAIYNGPVQICRDIKPHEADYRCYLYSLNLCDIHEDAARQLAPKPQTQSEIEQWRRPALNDIRLHSYHEGPLLHPDGTRERFKTPDTIRAFKPDWENFIKNQKARTGRQQIHDTIEILEACAMQHKSPLWGMNELLQWLKDHNTSPSVLKFSAQARFQNRIA